MSDLFDDIPEAKIEISEDEFFERIDDTPQYADEDVELKEDLFEDDKVESGEEKKRFKKLNSLGAKSIVKSIDIGFANIAAKIAYSDQVVEYRADPEAIEDLQEVIEEIIPKKDDGIVKIPLWLQLLIFLAIAFVPVLLKAWTDRKENKLLYEKERKIKELEAEIKAKELEIELSELNKKENA